MKRPLLLCILFATATIAFAQTDAYNIIPKPAKLIPREGRFVFDASTRIVVPAGDPDIFNAAYVLLERLILSAGLMSVRIEFNANDEIKPDKNMLFCKFNSSIANKEAYKMTIDSERIEIEAGASTGIFYAMQTIRQLLPPEIERNGTTKGMTWSVPCAIIEDEPICQYRGMMIDMSRHFSSVNHVRRYIDWLAYHKLNHLHLRLTDDHGWRLEIKNYPKLTETGDGGYFTREQVRNIVAHAQRRFVTVIPEIAMPGRAHAALTAYPELSCTNDTSAVSSHRGKCDDVFCTKNETFEFLEKTISELILMFPSEYVHIGGDDFSKTRWQNCEHCQAKIKELELEDEQELKNYFIERIEKIVNSKGKHLIIRDDIPFLNFDYYQTQNRENEPLAADGYLPLEEVYAFDPALTETEDDETEAETGKIQGGQCNLWREFITSEMHLEYMMFPRLSAFAEALWTPPTQKNYDDYLTRLPDMLKRYETMNIIYSRTKTH